MTRWRWRSMALALGGAWAVTWLVNRSLVEVRGPSMLPTLREGQRLLTVPASLWPRRPRQVVVVEDPTRPDHRVVKRVARVTADGVVVLGDNPGASTDSRAWGPVRPGAVRRVVVARWAWPPSGPSGELSEQRVWLSQGGRARSRSGGLPRRGPGRCSDGHGR